MATIRLSVLKTRQTAKGTYLIYLAVCHKRDTRYIATDFEIDDLFQFENGKVIYRKDAKIMNQRLEYILSEYQNKLNSIPNSNIYNCSQLKEILEAEEKGEQLITIKEFFEYRIKELRKEGRESYAEMNEYTLSKIISILGDITLQSITPSTIEKFVKGMKNFSNATKQMRLTHFKARINEAIKEKLVKYEEHPFSTTKIPKSGVKLMDITVEEFRKIRDYETNQKGLNLAKDLFLLSFYSGGMNLADIVVSNFSGGVLEYERRKTDHSKQGEKIVKFSIAKEAQPIIDKYIKKNGKLDFGYKLSYTNFRRYVNSNLSKLAKHVGIKTNFSFYSARKTFSQFAFDLGVKTEIVEYCIGQSMKENRPIYNYIRVMQRQADAAINRVIDYTNDPQKYDAYLDMTVQMYPPMMMQNNC